jgi:hypothetical protein
VLRALALAFLRAKMYAKITFLNNVAIRRLVSAIEQLPRDIGRAGGGQRPESSTSGSRQVSSHNTPSFAVDPATVRMVGRIGGRLAITVYGSALSTAGQA